MAPSARILLTISLALTIATTAALAAPLGVTDRSTQLAAPISWYPCIAAHVASYTCTGRTEDCRPRKDWGNGRFGLWCPTRPSDGKDKDKSPDARAAPDDRRNYYEWHASADGTEGALYSYSSIRPIALCSVDDEGLVCDPKRTRLPVQRRSAQFVEQHHAI